MNNKVLFLAKAGIIAALYTVITLLIIPLSYGGMQVRISEALTILPFFTSAAVPGLFVGCLLANLFGSPLGLIDIVLGSLSTLLAAFITSKIKNKLLVPLPSILVNALVIPYVLWIALGIPYFVSVFYVGLGQAIAVYGLGYPLLLFIEKNKKLRETIKDS
ncbi:QueT transporter family protein [Alkalibaculum sp. M08DMB]|uniref:QueT transporter family protein n=1 Tax=Alkalibaculum sporogenes TaxID=2655001 RepID=A0A6A7K6L3_9FIRM|nr:QueT transporter family protein [Alkalibaculum sporogenes]MPW24981.1 QueT transporter family protein [Alkalibaculum sporogenes]